MMGDGLLVEENLRLHAADVANKAVKMSASPVLLQIEVTNRCNQACRSCARNYWDGTTNPLGDMPAELLVRLRPFVGRAEKVLMGGYGEPLLGAHLSDILAEISKAGGRMEIITNGTLLTPERISELLGVGVKFLVISVDGVSDGTLRKLRGISLAEIQGIFARLRDAREGVPPETFPRLTVNFAACTSNVEELPDLLRRAPSWGVSTVRVSHVRVFDDSLVSESLFNDRQRAQEVFDEARAVAIQAGIHLELPYLDDEQRDCWQPFQTLLVRWNGDVMACSSAVFSGGARFHIGNVNVTDPWDLWNGEAMQAYRHAVHEKGALPEPCRICCGRRFRLRAQLCLLNPGSQKGRHAGDVRRAKRRRFALIGIDGAEPRLVDHFIRMGDLPNLRRMRDDGIGTILKSTIHPNTPPAWTSMTTGVNPGKHGIYDFRQRVADGYGFQFVDSSSVRTMPLWDILSRAGKAVGVINVPLTHPVRPVNGFIIGGMHSPSLEAAVMPRDLGADLAGIMSGYRIDVEGCDTGTDGTDFPLACIAMAEARANAGSALYRQRDPDFFMIVFSAADRLQHICWHEVEDLLQGRTTRESPRVKALRDIYRICDDFVGELLDEADEDLAVWVVSDHGFGSLEKDVYMNVFLQQRGFLHFLDEQRGAAGRKGAWTPPSGARGEGFERVDWSRTTAYSRGFFGNVFLNVAGREPLGIVRPGDYQTEIARLTEALYELRDPESGECVVDAVYPRDVLYHGKMTEQAPDLLVVMRNYAYMTRDGSELSCQDIFSAPQSGHSGNHRLNGLFMALPWSAPVGLGTRVRRQNILDVAPSVLTWLGLDVPAYMDGEPVGGLVDRHAPDAPVLKSATADEDRAQPASSDEDRALMEDRMRALGYMA